MDNEKVILIGPLTTDDEFLQALDYEKFPALKDCKQAIEVGDAAKARKIFADTARGIFDPEKFFSLPSRDPKPAMTEQLKATAERALRHEMRSCGTTMKYQGKVDWFANPTFNQYKEWTWQLSRHDELIHLARAFRACGDQRYADGCAELLDSWIKQAVRPEYSTGSYATLCWRTIECGIRMGLMWPELIHTFCANPAFTDDLIFDYFKSVYEHTQRMLNAFTVGNWLMHELDGLAQCGIFYPVFKDSDKWIEIAMTKMEQELREKQVYADGFQFESSTGYHGVVLVHVMGLIEVCREYGVTVPRSMYDAIESMLSLYVKLMQANGKMPHPNDGGGADCAASIRRYMKYFPENQQFRWIVTGGKEGNIPDYGSILLEYCGHYALRTDDWSNAASAFFDAGVFGHGHQHEDKLNLTICNSERPILCEANTYAYDTSEERKYCLISAGHNVILVNGKGQNRRGCYKWNDSMLFKKAENVRLTVTPCIDTAIGVYDEGYGEAMEKLATHKRTVMMLKKPAEGSPIFIVVD